MDVVSSTPNGGINDVLLSFILLSDAISIFHQHPVDIFFNTVCIKKNTFRN